MEVNLCSPRPTVQRLPIPGTQAGENLLHQMRGWTPGPGHPPWGGVWAGARPGGGGGPPPPRGPRGGGGAPPPPTPPPPPPALSHQALLLSFVPMPWISTTHLAHCRPVGTRLSDHRSTSWRYLSAPAAGSPALAAPSSPLDHRQHHQSNGPALPSQGWHCHAMLGTVARGPQLGRGTVSLPLEKPPCRGTQLAPWVEHVTFDLSVMSSSPMLGTEPT